VEQERTKIIYKRCVTKTWSQILLNKYSNTTKLVQVYKLQFCHSVTTQFDHTQGFAKELNSYKKDQYLKFTGLKNVKVNFNENDQ